MRSNLHFNIEVLCFFLKGKSSYFKKGRYSFQVLKAKRVQIRLINKILKSLKYIHQEQICSENNNLVK